MTQEFNLTDEQKKVLEDVKKIIDEMKTPIKNSFPDNLDFNNKWNELKQRIEELI